MSHHIQDAYGVAPSQTPSQPQYSAYYTPSYPPPPAASDTSHPGPNANISRQAFDSNHNAIPGLGLGFANRAPEWQPQWVASPQATHPTQESTRTKSGVEEGPGTNSSSAKTSSLDDVDEGELSEGELEDLYEPQYPTEPTDAPSIMPDLRAKPGNNQLAAAESGMDTEDTDVYDRGGSYSPYLSPNELEQSEPETLPQAPLSDLSPIQSQSEGLQSRTESAQPASHAGHFDATTEGTSISDEKSVTTARKQAQDAILRLWPLNVRFGDYVHEGIDASLLQGLFRELGLDPAALSENSPSVDMAIPRPEPKIPQKDNAPASETIRPANPAAPVVQEAAPSAQNESRKDRIARLLAAQGSKASTVEPASKPSSPKPAITLSPKAVSEKSRLLKQKHEALMRAREAKEAKKLAGEVTPSEANSGAPKENPVTQLGNGNQTPSAEVENISVPASPPVSDLPVPPAQLAPTTTQQKRPVASDLNDSSEGPSKRPFGHGRQYQKFLIDVSDDEDDEAMDLDSPELRPASTNRPSSPFKIPAFRDLHTAPVQRSDRHASSPMPTPPANYNSDSDLASVTKKIEEMKRKIAEAEAKSKAKLSRPVSPAVGPAQGLQRAISSSTIPIASTEEPEAHGASPQPRQPESQRLPKVADARGLRSKSRGRSRAASERLSTLEAHRKEKLLKLRALQSQVQRIERDIQESLQEEERLKSEAVDESGSDGNFDEDMASPPRETPDVQNSEAARPETHRPVDNSTEAPVVPRPDETPASHDTPPTPPAQAVVEEAEPMAADSGEISDEDDDAEMDIVQDLPEEPVEAATNRPERSGADSETVYPEHEDAEGSDEYEPAEAPSEQDSDGAADLLVDNKAGAPTEAPADEHSDASSDTGLIADSSSTSDNEIQAVSIATPITQPISTGHQESKPPSPREEPRVLPTPPPTAPKTSFVPYQTPLKYFRSYRFHPRFPDAVTGGLRSLTYSNKIDVKKELCPDQLAGSICPRGEQCEFQHFETMEAADDQILLQLGAYGDYEGEKKQEYINGLRQLLTDYRSRKIKDFKTISQGIIDYRAQFRKDPTKVLPLGDVSL